MNELKPCPFCGGKARIMLEEEHIPDGCFHNIYCTICGVQFWVKSITEAINKWNRRVEEINEQGCVWCKEDNKVFHDGQHFHFFCSYCGKRLEVKQND